jgi:predicted DCC family thiol-disulfide oxidoreductase YuxK
VLPYQEAPSPPMTPALHEACARAVHVVKSDGTLLRAGRATLFILEQIGWGWFARVLSWPPFIWIVELVYSLVANNRRFFSRFLFRDE